MADEESRNPMSHPREQAAGTDDAPKFGRLLLVLFGAVLLVVLITFASLAYYT